MSFATRVLLFDNVPFTKDYQHTRWFNTSTEQTNFFNGLNPKENIIDGRHIKILDGKFKILGGADYKDYFNYCIIENIETGKTGQRKYFCFVTNVDYINTGTMEIEFEVDVLQTYRFDMEFKPSFVERQHSSPTQILEDLNVGSDYITRESLILRKEIDQEFHTLVVTTTQTIHTSDTYKTIGDVSQGVASPLINYLFLIPKSGSGVISVNDIELYGGAHTKATILKKLFNAFQSESSANAIVSINYIPFFPYPTTISGRSVTITGGDYAITEWDDGTEEGKFKTIISASSQSYPQPITFDLGNIQTLLANAGMPVGKLRQAPYSLITLYDGLGNHFEIKPELISTPDLVIQAGVTFGSVPRVAYWITNYKGTIQTSVLHSTPNIDVEILNDHTATYMQGRRNADRVASVQSAVGGIAQVGMGAVMAGVSASIGAPLGIASGVGMIAGGVQNGYFGQSQILAKHEDIDNIPPSLLNQAGGTTVNIAYDMFYAHLEIRTVRDDIKDQVDSYFKQFGYATQKMLLPNLRTKTRYNFVKTIGANIVGSIPQNYLVQLRNIFDQGITLWHVNDMYNYSLANNDR